MKIRGIRGAITVNSNSKEEIINSTKELLREMIEKNQVDIEEICFILFSATDDLDAAFPAQAAREMGMKYVPLLDFSHMKVPEDLKRCIRILMVFNSDKKPEEIKHVYLKEAKRLRPDL
ncbi:chorismate mutase [Thermovenabulum gondwanense]|uniref:chorismate mutase n=1 Tax=Thermovenabulum gondwanense TaxID=520767 RepID=A0A162M8L8_9FIRM|nr:chorismate mutase [Thermovenabulum gondwanense]KYO64533.1 Chorismate mutase AroH [Thermovenabulum gondwanense]